MKTLYCESCGEKADEIFNPLIPVQINVGKKERTYMCCEVCREKLDRIITGHAL